jgi:hypothetical protein
MKTYQQFKD